MAVNINTRLAGRIFTQFIYTWSEEFDFVKVLTDWLLDVSDYMSKIGPTVLSLIQDDRILSATSLKQCLSMKVLSTSEPYLGVVTVICRC